MPRKHSPPPEPPYLLRKRRRRNDQETPLEVFLKSLSSNTSFVIFSGSGLSADAGVSLFSTEGGLYQRAKDRFRLHNGQTLFNYDFFQKHRVDVQAFFAEIYEEVVRCRPGPSHKSIEELDRLGCLVGHYTLNIDGLSRELSSSKLVEVHGNIRWMFCAECGRDDVMTSEIASLLKKLNPLSCPTCKATMRSKILLYGDRYSDRVTDKQNLWNKMQRDLKTADCVLWIGMSFKQAASIEYFRTVRRLEDANKRIRHVLINPDSEASFDLVSGIDRREAEFLHVEATSSYVLRLCIDKLQTLRQ